jgi:hypothetical protein
MARRGAVRQDEGGMLAKRMQRRWVVGNLYEVVGVGTRWFKLMARVRVGKGEVLILRPVRRARKMKKSKVAKARKKT